jgi:uncharacterized protein (DUF302 family)
MKSRIIIFLSGMMAGIGMVALALFLILPGQMFTVEESKLGFDETVEAIGKSAVENHWNVPHQYDLQASMKKSGFEVNPVKVFSLCKPEHASQILSGGSEKMVSALMPCRVAVYEENGKTYVSMLNSGLFSRLMGKKVSSVMGKATLENQKIIEPVIQ